MEYSDNIEKALLAAGVVLSEGASNLTPRRTGNLAASIFTGKVKKNAGGFEVVVGVDPTELAGSVNYAPFVHNGTGIYGPKKKKIFPKNAKALKIGKNFRMFSKGQKPQPFFDDAVDKYADDAADEFLRKLEVGFG